MSTYGSQTLKWYPFSGHAWSIDLYHCQIYVKP
ncbi:hypothetical protein KLGR536_21460 [Klebsiella grimontii]